MTKVKGKRYWLWIAFEPRLRAFLDLRISYTEVYWMHTSSSGVSDRSMVEKLYVQMMLTGTKRHADGLAWNIMCTERSGRI
jgi:hypothetical protein